MTTSSDFLKGLRERICQHFSLEEIRDLCYDLNVDYERLTGENKLSFVRELLKFLSRNGRLPELIDLLQEQRSHITWPTVPDDLQPPAAIGNLNTNPMKSPLSTIIEHRVQAEDWKELHEQSQIISKNLFELRGMILLSDDVALRILLQSWQIMHSSAIREFVRFEKLSDGPVRERFLQRNQETVWLINLSGDRQKMDNIINELKDATQLQARMREIMETLNKLEAAFSQILYFADQGLKKTIRELDKAIVETDKMLGENG